MNTSKRFLVALPLLLLLSATYAKTPDLADGLDPADDEVQVYALYRQAFSNPSPVTTHTTPRATPIQAPQPASPTVAQQEIEDRRNKIEELAVQAYTQRAAQEKRNKEEQLRQQQERAQELQREQEELVALQNEKSTNQWIATGEAGLAVLLMGGALATELYNKSIAATAFVIVVTGNCAIDFVRRYKKNTILKEDIAYQKAVITELIEAQQH